MTTLWLSRAVLPLQYIVDFLKDASGAFMPHSQVQNDPLLTSMTDTVDIGYVAK